MKSPSRLLHETIVGFAVSLVALSLISLPSVGLAQSSGAEGAMVGLLQSPGALSEMRAGLSATVDVHIETLTGVPQGGVDVQRLTARIRNLSQILNTVGKGCGLQIRQGESPPQTTYSRSVVFLEVPTAEPAVVKGGIAIALHSLIGDGASAREDQVADTLAQLNGWGMGFYDLNPGTVEAPAMVLWNVDKLSKTDLDAALDFGIFAGLTGIVPVEQFGGAVPFAFFTDEIGPQVFNDSDESHFRNVCAALSVAKAICQGPLGATVSDQARQMAIIDASCMPGAPVCNNLLKLDAITMPGSVANGR